MKQSEPTRVAWAIDFLAGDWETERQMAKALYLLSRHTPLIIEPVALVDRAQWEQTYCSYGGEKTAPASALVEHMLREWLDTLTPFERLLPPKALVLANSSLTHRVQVFLRYAEERKSQLIAASYHDPNGLDRFLLGSFVEGLLSETKLPVFISTPQSQVPREFDKVLFPTDFSPISWQAFKHTVSLSADLGAELVLFHEPARLPLGVSAWSLVADRASIDRAHARAEGERWADWGRQRTVPVIFRLDTRRRPAARSILAFARATQPGFIVMGSDTRRFGSVLRGSVARQVLREADCPVLVIHSSKRAAALHLNDAA